MAVTQFHSCSFLLRIRLLLSLMANILEVISQQRIRFDQWIARRHPQLEFVVAYQPELFIEITDGIMQVFRHMGKQPIICLLRASLRLCA